MDLDLDLNAYEADVMEALELDERQIRRTIKALERLNVRRNTRSNFRRWQLLVLSLDAFSRIVSTLSCLYIHYLLTKRSPNKLF